MFNNASSPPPPQPQKGYLVTLNILFYKTIAALDIHNIAQAGAERTSVDCLVGLVPHASGKILSSTLSRKKPLDDDERLMKRIARFNK